MRTWNWVLKFVGLAVTLCLGQGGAAFGLPDTGYGGDWGAVPVSFRIEVPASERPHRGSSYEIYRYGYHSFQGSDKSYFQPEMQNLISALSPEQQQRVKALQELSFHPEGNTAEEAVGNVLQFSKLEAMRAEAAKSSSTESQIRLLKLEQATQSLKFRIAVQANLRAVAKTEFEQKRIEKVWALLRENAADGVLNHLKTVASRQLEKSQSIEIDDEFLAGLRLALASQESSKKMTLRMRGLVADVFRYGSVSTAGGRERTAMRAVILNHTLDRVLELTPSSELNNGMAESMLFAVGRDILADPVAEAELLVFQRTERDHPAHRDLNRVLLERLRRDSLSPLVIKKHGGVIQHLLRVRAEVFVQNESLAEEIKQFLVKKVSTPDLDLE